MGFLRGVITGLAKSEDLPESSPQGLFSGLILVARPAGISEAITRHSITPPVAARARKKFVE